MTLRHLRQIFQVRSCRMKFATDDEGATMIVAKSGKTPPCMDYYIGLCPAPCLLETPKILEHQKHLDQLKKFLRGQMGEVIADLRAKMTERAKNLEFEEAGKIKAQIESIEVLGQKQIARDAVRGACDVVMILEKYSKTFIGRTEVRNGEIQGIHHTQATPALDEGPEEILEQYLAETYAERDGSDLVLLLEKPLVSDTVGEFLKRGSVRVEIPESGSKHDLLSFNRTNLLGFAYREEMENLTKKTLTRGTMENILTELGFDIPKK
jgi:excinuclease ABC subunit C